MSELSFSFLFPPRNLSTLMLPSGFAVYSTQTQILLLGQVHLHTAVFAIQSLGEQSKFEHGRQFSQVW